MFKRSPLTMMILAVLMIFGCETDKSPLTREDGGGLLGGSQGFSTFGWDTPVAVSATEFKTIQNILPGDAIYGCDASLEWRSETVTYSDGVAPSPRNQLTMIFVRYLLMGEQRQIVVTGGTLFLMADGSFQQAQSLYQGMLLQGADGSQVPVQAVMKGGWIRGVQSISTSYESPSGGILIEANGLLCPDFAYVRSHNL